MEQNRHEADADRSPDRDDRIKDFLARHGGAGKQSNRGESGGGTQGWYEVYATDGYRLRCEWSRMGDEEKMAFSEIAPAFDD
jgi:hypothetical protein